jgi:S-DNA-T family DNA segregation ATPase FtsK/SpoIIIE
MQLVREGSRYGVYFVVTVINYNEIKYRFVQNFNKQFVLQQNDTSDYSMILGNTNGLYPAKYQGRGLFASNDDKLFEFQTAAVSKDESIEYIGNFVNELSNESSAFASKIPVLPDSVTIDYMKAYNLNPSYKSFAVGINYNNLQIATVDYEKTPIVLVASQDIDDVEPFVCTLAKYSSYIEDSEVVVFDTTKNFEEAKQYELFNSNFETKFEKVYRTVVSRYKALRDNNGVAPEDFDMHHIFCVIYGLTNLLNGISSEYADKITTMFEKCKAEFNVSFLICDTPIGISRYSTDDWYKEKCNGNGIWIGDGILDQFVFNISKRTKDMSTDINNEYGFVINKGKANLVKLLHESED